MLEAALRDHSRVVSLLQHRRSQLEHCLKFWQQDERQSKPPLQSTVDALVMMADSNCAFDLMAATFAKGLRVNEMTVSQVTSILKKLKDLLDRTSSEFQLEVGVQILA